jgi:tRNA pseudouridine synthase 10
MDSQEGSRKEAAADPISGSCPKDALCYQCGLRMSMLFNYPPPRPLTQLLQQPSLLSAEATTATTQAYPCPVLDDEHHPFFTIVHETAESAQRYFAGALKSPSTATAEGMATEEPHLASSTECGNAEKKASTNGSTAHGMLAGDAAPKYAVSWLCTACMGLYQFIDLIHAPLAAAEVRASPYFDSAAITINVNVNRSFTFTWLAVATRYFDVKGTGVDRPPATSVVKEELSNFKDFYMSDLRARILPYLLHHHNDIVASATLPSVISRSTPLPGVALYIEAVNNIITEKLFTTEEETEGTNTDERTVKKARCECSLASNSCSSCNDSTSTTISAEAASCTSPNLRALQAFSYSGNGDSLVGEVFCRHHATEGLITEGYLPAAYCGNRSTEVLPYSVIYDYAVPYLMKIGWFPAPDNAEDKGTENCSGASPVRDRRPAARTAATVSCQLQHTNIFLMGNYCKMMRNMSQSPWFLNGQRIGSYSLQEVIANPVLPFFFPDLPAVPPDAQLEGNGGSTAATTGAAGEPTAASRADRGAHSSRWQSVAPSEASSLLVFGYNRYKFHSAGREDVDVRMLGDGRPFVLELVSPMREHFTEADLRRLEAAINDSYVGSVKVSRLRRTDAEVTVRLARHSESKVKRYRCVIWSSRAIDDFTTDAHVQAIHAAKDLMIAQKTPLRVLHRRSLHPRPRLIHSMKLTPINAHWFLLDLETQAGTYVKEFVHGDMGRTVPHLGMLLNARTDIIQLDVVGMAMHDLDGE